MNITRLKRAVIKEEYIAITGDMLESVILNQFIYWSERVGDFDKFIKEENERQEKYCRPSQGEEPIVQPLLHGWIYKKAAELKEEIMSTDSEKTINRKLTSLVEKGFLDRRNNPKIKYDRTYQYRVNFENIIKALLEKGYMLQDYRVDLKFIVEALKTDKGQNDESQSHGVESQGQNDASVPDIHESQRQIDALKKQIDELKKQNDAIKKQGVGAIPETTIEITPKTTIESNTESSIADTVPDNSTSDNLIEQFYNLVKNEISDVSFKTWIEPLVINIDKNTATLKTKDSFIPKIIKDRYIDIINRSFNRIGILKVEIETLN